MTATKFAAFTVLLAVSVQADYTPNAISPMYGVPSAGGDYGGYGATGGGGGGYSAGGGAGGYGGGHGGGHDEHNEARGGRGRMNK